MELFDKMVEISDSNKTELKVLEQKIQQIKIKSNEYCRYGKFC